MSSATPADQASTPRLHRGQRPAAATALAKNPSTLQHGSSSAHVANQLRDAILRGDYPPGSRIRQDELAAQSGASRLPVREALRTLEAEGLLTVVANTGAWVSTLSLAECEEIYQLRERIEPLLLRYSLPRMGDDTVAELERLCAQMEAGGDTEEFLRLDREFHLLSYAASDTVLLGDLTVRLWNRTQHYRRAFAQQIQRSGRRIMHDEHHMIVSAVRDGDSEAAERVLAGHIQRTRHELARHPEIFEEPHT